MICLLSGRLPWLCNTSAMTPVYIVILWVYEGRPIVSFKILHTSPGQKALSSCSQYKVQLNRHDRQSGKIFSQHRLTQCRGGKCRHCINQESEHLSHKCCNKITAVISLSAISKRSRAVKLFFCFFSASLDFQLQLSAERWSANIAADFTGIC